MDYICGWSEFTLREVNTLRVGRATSAPPIRVGVGTVHAVLLDSTEAVCGAGVYTKAGTPFSRDVREPCDDCLAELGL